MHHRATRSGSPFLYTTPSDLSYRTIVPQHCLPQAAAKYSRGSKAFSCIQDSAKRHLGELPGAVPVDLAFIIAAHQLVDEHPAKIFALAAEHEFLCVRLCRLEEVELRVGHDTDAFECHQRAHYVREI